LSVSTPRRAASGAQPVVKHPLAWYMPRFWHGMRFTTWVRNLARNRFAVSPSRIPMTCAITGFTAINSALAGAEKLIYGRRIAAVELAQQPLFILGHWRAGTTFLHELMIRDPAHAYPTTYQCFAPNHFVLSERYVTPWAGMFVPERRPMDNMAAGWDRPMEDEFALANMGAPSLYLSFMFPNHGGQDAASLTLEGLSARQLELWKSRLLRFIKSLSLGDNRRLVLKSPPHTGRVRTLRAMFPKAKFVHICRDPYSLYRSTMALWRSLNAEEGLQVAKDRGQVQVQVLDNLRRMYDAYLDDRRLLGDDQLIELRYEDLIEDPKAQLRMIYDRLGLGEFARVEPALDEHLAEVKNYRTNRHSMDDETAALIRTQWSRYLDEFGYE
jgi:omega-hydroxy-beta-dihydromenaquinone-9 sulfotransferase